MKRRLLPFAIIIAIGCEAPPSEDVTAAVLPIFSVSAPVVEIGVLEGADEYIFGSIEDVVQLSDGRVAVSDGGANRVSIFDPTGHYVRSWGSEGDGPGEFRSLSRLYLRGDSILAADRRNSRVSIFDQEGAFVRQVDATELSGDSTFALDSWLYGRFWVDGALTPEARARVKSVLDEWPQPRLTPGFRAVRVARNGDLWIREPARDGSGRNTVWTRTNEAGVPVAIVETPSNFHPRDISDDRILGVWIGEADVQFVRGYELVEAGAMGPIPAWLLGEESDVPAGLETNEEDVRSLMRQSIRMIASAQEIHYSRHYSYTVTIDSLTAFEPPEGLAISFAFGNARGWAAVFTHPGYDRICGLAYGFDIPPGWQPGQIICAPSPGPPPSQGN